MNKSNDGIEYAKVDEAKITKAEKEGRLVPFEKMWDKIPAKRKEKIEEQVVKKIMARKLKEMREKKKVSQESLAQRAGLKREAIARIESGKHNPTITTLNRIAGAMNKELVVEFIEAKAIRN